MGVHPFADPRLVDDFAAVELPLDARDFHVYAAEWSPGRVVHLVDGEPVRTVKMTPDYPMQMMIGVFDFPGKPDAAAHADHVPRLVVDYVREA